LALLAHHPQERLAVLFIAREGAAMVARDPRRLRVGLAGHDGGDRRRIGTAFVAVVRQAARHQQRPQVGVTESQRTVIVAVPLDRFRWIARVRDDDLLRRDQGAAGRLERGDVELAIVLDELHQVDRCQVARRIVQEHVLRARIARIDPVGVRAGMPVVHRRVELHAGVAAHPRAFRDLPHQVVGLVRLHHLAARDRLGLPVAVVQDRAHEVVGDAHAVVGVLEEDRSVGHTGERSVVAGVDQRPGFFLFLHLAVDEIENVWMVGVEDDHLGGAPGLTA
jgi:hypothetical protein